MQLKFLRSQMLDKAIKFLSRKVIIQFKDYFVTKEASCDGIDIPLGQSINDIMYDMTPYLGN